MSTKCYIVNYDNKINKFKQLLSTIHTKERTFNNNNNNLLHDKQNLQKYLSNIDNYLDSILNDPSISDEELYNIKQDQEEILSILKNINSEINTLQQSINSDKTNIKKTLEKDDNEKSNIIINITSGDKKTSIYPELKK